MTTLRTFTVAAAFVALAAPGRALVAPNYRDYGVPMPPPGAMAEAAPAANAAARPAVSLPPRNLAALSTLQQTGRTPFSVAWDAASGNARLLYAGRSRAYEGAPEVAARAFLRDAAPVLGAPAPPDALGAPTVVPHPLGTQVYFPQEDNGIPVLNRGVTVNLNAAGEVILAENTTAPTPEVDTTPSVSAVRAAGFARGAVVQPPSLAIDAGGAEARLVWRFVEKRGDGIPARVTVDAHTGRALRRVPLAHMAQTGYGSVYRGNPVSTPARETLPLTNLDGYGKLTGTYARIFLINYIGQTFSPTQTAMNGGLQFSYGTGTAELSQTQAYYGISNIHDWFKSTFNFTRRDHQIPGFVRDTTMANAYFSPDTSYEGQPTPNGYMAFGYAGSSGYPTADFALDTDVLYHEYTHAVMDKLAPAFSNASYDDMERGGIGEGVADYFSSTILNDPVLGEYSAQAFGESYIRDLRGRYHYPEEVQVRGSISLNGALFNNVRVYPEEHQTGEIWGPALWDLRVMLGKDKADKLIFNGMALLNAGTTFQSAMAALLTADDTLYGGADKPVIRDVFGKRGITEDAYPIKYLDWLAFYSDATNGSKIAIGLPYVDGGVATIYNYDTFPSFNAGESYLFAGYSDDPTIKTVAIVLRNSSNAVVAKVTTPTRSFRAKDTNGVVGTFYYFQVAGTFPASLIPSGKTALTGLKLSIQSYTQVQSTVDSSFNSLTPKATAPAAGTTYAAQIILPQVTPPIFPPAFGDTDGNGKVNVNDALLVMRALAGRSTLTADQKQRADVAAPLDGNPNIADARMILQRAGGLL